MKNKLGIERRMLLDVVDAAYLIEQRCVHVLQPLPELPEGQYYTINDRGTIIVVRTRRRHSQLAKMNHIPVVGLLIIQDYIENVISTRTRWSKHVERDWTEIFGHYFITKDDTYVDVEVERLCTEVIPSILSDIGRTVSDFIGEDDWKIHKVTLSGGDITLTKCEDFRIYEWRRLTQNGLLSSRQL